MMDEPAPPRSQRGAVISELSREDLELYAAAELRERIERLESEIERTREAFERKQSGRAAAESLFSFG